MKSNDLIARYIYAVTRHLPSKTRAEVEKELDSLIADMLDERCGDMPPSNKDMKIILLELGTPEELAAKYSGEEKKSLISGTYYIAYRRILKLVLPIVAGAVALGMVISVLLNPAENPLLFTFQLLGQTVGGAIGGAWQAFAVITLIFAVLERTKADIGGMDPFASLPPVPNKSERIKPYEPILGICCSIAAAVLFLGFPHIIGVHTAGGDWTSVFDVAVLRSLWLPIILWTVLEIATESVKLMEGRNTKRLAVVTITGNGLMIVCAAVIFLGNSLINPDILPLVGGLLDDKAHEFLGAKASYISALIFCLICIALVIEAVTSAVKAWKATICGENPRMPRNCDWIN